MQQQQQNTKQNYEKQEVCFLVVGGGIAGVTCAETLAICCPEESIILLTESRIIKTISNLQPVARYLHRFDVKEKDTSSEQLQSSVLIIVDTVSFIHSEKHYVLTIGNRLIKYRYLCVCTGGRPHLIADDNNLVVGVRDTDSVVDLQNRLNNAKSVLLVGNGGIASDLVNELRGIDIHWVVRDNHIASKFIDPGAAQFFLENLQNKENDTLERDDTRIFKRLRYDELLLELSNKQLEKSINIGAALGPNWRDKFTLNGSLGTTNFVPRIYYKTDIKDIKTINNNTLQVSLVSGETITCNFIISATGVTPRHDINCDKKFEVAEDDGIKVNDMMQTNLPNIYAAGDVCSATWEEADHWFQMRLWTQARQMGSMAGRSMAASYNGEKIYQDFCFELFGHITQLFEYEVVLIGRYNGQGLGKNYEILIRSTPGKEYIKFVLQNGRLRGAILIGNTELAEMCENLILNGIDLTPFGDDILNPDIDIEDYFD